MCFRKITLFRHQQCTPALNFIEVRITIICSDYEHSASSHTRCAHNNPPTIIPISTTQLPLFATTDLVSFLIMLRSACWLASGGCCFCTCTYYNHRNLPPTCELREEHFFVTSHGGVSASKSRGNCNNCFISSNEASCLSTLKNNSTRREDRHSSAAMELLSILAATAATYSRYFLLLLLPPLWFPHLFLSPSLNCPTPRRIAFSATIPCTLTCCCCCCCVIAMLLLLLCTENI